jgi:hypothetical protein
VSPVGYGCKVFREDGHGRKVGKGMGQRRETEKVADRKKVALLSMGPLSPEVPSLHLELPWASPLVVELPCLCISSFSQVRCCGKL